MTRNTRNSSSTASNRSQSKLLVPIEEGEDESEDTTETLEEDEEVSKVSSRIYEYTNIRVSGTFDLRFRSPCPMSMRWGEDRRTEWKDVGGRYSIFRIRHSIFTHPHISSIHARLCTRTREVTDGSEQIETDRSGPCIGALDRWIDPRSSIGRL